MAVWSDIESARRATFSVEAQWPLQRLADAVGPVVDAGVTLARTVRPERATALARLGHQWNALGQGDALGAVLTRPSATAGWDVADFFETGRADVERLMCAIASQAPGLMMRRALDFGCGVGRLTQPLANHFTDVQGVDVSESMIARARLENATPARCHFQVNRRPHLRRFKTGTFDLVYSRLVLQHMPPTLVSRYIPELVRVLASGGLLVFQLPGVISDPKRLFCEAPVRGRLKRALPRRVVHAYRRLKYPLCQPPPSRMDMFGMARDTVVALVEDAGARILMTTADDSHGTSVPGFEYWVTR
jgi:SAM-dependent methyltransferase